MLTSIVARIRYTFKIEDAVKPFIFPTFSHIEQPSKWQLSMVERKNGNVHYCFPLLNMKSLK